MRDPGVQVARPSLPLARSPLAGGLAVLALVGFVVLMSLSVLPPTLGAAVSYLVQCATVLTAAALLAVRARTGHGRLRRARALLSACLVTVTVAGLLALWVRATSDGPPPLPSVADVVHFAFLPLCVAGFLHYPVRGDHPASRWRVLMDGAVAGAALWFAVWTVLLEPTGIAALPPAALLTALAYPVSDVVVIAVAAGTLVRVAPEARREVGLAAAGVSVYAVSDVAYTVQTVEGSYRPDSWVGALAQVGLVLILLAALHAGRPCPGRGVEPRLAAAAPYLSVAVAVLAGVYAAVVLDGLDASETVAAAVVAATMLVRQWVAHRDLRQALARVGESRARLHHESRHDALTGLPNRTAALERLVAGHTGPRGGQDAPVVALVDLDGFKEVNDTYGHQEGDRLLVAVAERIRACTRQPDLVARIGGDEFVLVLEDRAAAEVVARRVLRALREPVAVGERQLVVHASIGLAPLDGPSPDTSLRDADLAMYAAKTAGRDRFAWFEPALHEAATARAETTARLREALAADGLTLHYQPIVDLADGSLAGVEALLRWFDADGRAVPPDVFIPVAEASGLMATVDAWVLDRACADLAAWRAEGRAVPQVSVNVSRRHLTADLPALVAGVLARHGLVGADLCLEVTESAVAPDLAAASAALAAVRAAGVRVALDDFGTGQSSLSQLADLPVDVVKIDKSFVARAEVDGGRRLLRSVLSLCHALELRVVVEGVEDLATLPDLRRDGCHYAQGYALGRPAPAHVVAPRSAPAVPWPRTDENPAPAPSAPRSASVAPAGGG